MTQTGRSLPMTNSSVFLRLVVLTLSLLWLTDSTGADDPDVQKEALSAFAQPLLAELLRKGYSPRNAELATQHLLDDLARCWNSDRNISSTAEPKTVVVRLGGETIVTNDSVCLSEFLGIVEELPTP